MPSSSDDAVASWRHCDHVGAGIHPVVAAMHRHAEGLARVDVHEANASAVHALKLAIRHDDRAELTLADTRAGDDADRAAIGASVWPKNCVKIGPNISIARFNLSGAIGAAPYNTFCNDVAFTRCAADDKGNALKWAGSHLAVTQSPEGEYVRLRRISAAPAQPIPPPGTHCATPSQSCVASLGDAFDQFRNLRAEEFGDLFRRRVGVFDGVVQQAGDDCRGIEFVLSQNARDLNRVREIRVAGVALLRAVLRRRVDVRAVDQVLIDGFDLRRALHA